MKLLLDANISYRIVKKLQSVFAGSLHVSRTGLISPISDRSIWEFARKNDFTIVTFDEDFQELANLYGAPPKIVWLRFSPQTTPVIVEKLTLYKTEIETLGTDDETDLLEIF
jgi:predicted nuclease of predicted toxin-antitoxin system